LPKINTLPDFIIRDSAQPTPAYQPTTQVLASSSQSTLEESLKAFMQITGQSLSEVKNATMVNTQAIAKLKVQMGQMANHLGERKKGKLPSQPVPNPKLQFGVGSSSNLAHGQEHVQAIVTLRSGMPSSKCHLMPSSRRTRLQSRGELMSRRKFI